MSAWLGVALLAGSWLFGLDYFQPHNWLAWSLLIGAAVFLLGGVRCPLPPRAGRVLGFVLLLVPVWWVPMPWKAIPLLLAAGCALSLAPVPRRWVRQATRGTTVAGLILLFQGITLELYEIATARSHELPALLAGLVALGARTVGADAARDGAWLKVASTYGTERFAATWELLLDPATTCFVVGGLTLLVIARGGRRWGPGAVAAFGKTSLALVTIVLAWALLRATLLIGLVVQLVTLADPILFPNVGRVLVNSWLHCGLVLVPAVIVGALVRYRPRHGAEPRRRADATISRRRWALGVVAVAAACALLSALWIWAPVGRPKAGRVMVVERHSTWEPTIEPYATTIYGEAGSYTYAAVYAYCDQFYRMDRLLESDTISDDRLAQCDVLIIKTPTARYSPAEVAAVVRFVQNGGSVLLIGDHTNVFNMNTYLNDISRHFGFTFRNDLLFKIGSPYSQPYRPPRAAHPILFHVPPMQFAVSCSIDPGWNIGRMAIRNSGLYNLPPAYQESNYHPQAEYRPYMEYGAWCQLWTTTYGSGRVAAFADSTLFSNFCVYQPGKRELLMGMLEWLNRTSRWDRRGVRTTAVGALAGIALLLVVVGLRIAGRQKGGLFMLVVAGLAAWSAAQWAVHSAQRRAMPYPSPTRRRLPHVIIDRTVSDVPLFTGAFADDREGNGYGMLEQWIPRIGNYTSRAQGAAAFSGDGLVVICPTKLPSRAYRQRLIAWVRNGGHLLVFDSPDVTASTANSLLFLFGLSSQPLNIEPKEHPLEVAGLDESVPVLITCEITGGRSLATWDKHVAAAQITFGKGRVTAVGFGSLFNDNAMGSHWLVEPTPEVMQRYNALYALLRAALPSWSSPIASRQRD